MKYQGKEEISERNQNPAASRPPGWLPPCALCRLPVSCLCQPAMRSALLLLHSSLEAAAPLAAAAALPLPRYCHCARCRCSRLRLP
jgi:hypothetical protein